MRIDYNKPVSKYQDYTYYDMNGVEINHGDTVLMDGREWVVLLGDFGCLGVDSTNPVWIKQGRAVVGEYGVYPFEETDEPILVKKAENSKNSIDNE